MGLQSKPAADGVYDSLAAFLGAEYNDVLGTFTPIPYSDYGDLIDIEDDDSLGEALQKLDATKQRSLEIRDPNGDLLVINPNQINGPFIVSGRTVTIAGEQLLQTPLVVYTNQSKVKASTRQVHLVNVDLAGSKPVWANAAIIRATVQISGTVKKNQITEPAPNNGTGIYSEASAGFPLRPVVVAANAYRFGDLVMSAAGGFAVQSSFNNSLTMKVPLNGNILPVQHAWCGAAWVACAIEVVGFSYIATA